MKNTGKIRSAKQTKLKIVIYIRYLQYVMENILVQLFSLCHDFRWLVTQPHRPNLYNLIKRMSYSTISITLDVIS